MRIRIKKIQASHHENDYIYIHATQSYEAQSTVGDTLLVAGQWSSELLVALMHTKAADCGGTQAAWTL